MFNDNNMNINRRWKYDDSPRVYNQLINIKTVILSPPRSDHDEILSLFFNTGFIKSEGECMIRVHLQTCRSELSHRGEEFSSL